MEKIIKKANELGHLLNQNDIVKRFRELTEQMEKDEEAQEILNELLSASQAYQLKEEKGETIEVEEKKKLSDLQEKAKGNNLVGEFLATQTYYISLLHQVNEVIANPQGEPPKDSNIIVPDQDKGIIC